MKRSLFSFLMVVIVFGSSITLAQIPQVNNSGFENWTNLGGASEEPADWNSFKTADGTWAWASGQQVKRSTVIRPGSSGTYSAVIWARSAVGVIANGNLTTGRIQMGSTTPSSSSNYNRSVISDAAFHETLGAYPDSLVVWVRPKNSNTTHQPRIHAVVHDGGYDVRDPADGGSASHICGDAVLNFLPVNNVWTRMSIPFNYPGPSVDPAYILINITTCKDPGVGTAGDSLYIDDLQLIYNPPVATVSNTPDCGTGSVTVSTDKTGSQTFELCDNGGTMLQTWTGSASSHVFTGVSDGTYRGRVTWNALVSDLSSSTNLINFAIPTVTVQAENDTACENDNAMFSITADSSAATYQWQVNTGASWNDITVAGTSPEYSGWNTSMLTLTGVVIGNDGALYRCLVSGTNCDQLSDSAELMVEICTGIEDKRSSAYSVRPVPFHHELIIESATTDPITITLHSIDGRIVISRELAGNISYSLNTEMLVTGVYFLRINNGDQSEVIKVIRQ